MFNETKKGDIPRGGTIRAKAAALSRTLNYSADVILRLSFFYGMHRAIRLIRHLKKPSARQPIRVNTLKKDPEAVLASLRLVAGLEVEPSIFEDVLLVTIKGPYEVQTTGKAIIAKDKSAEKVMLGSNLYRPGVMRLGSEIEKGEEVNVKTQFGDVIAYGYSNLSAREKEMPDLVVRVEESKYKLVNLENLEVFQRGWAYPAPLLSTQAIKWFDPIEESILCVFPDYRDLAYLISLSDGNADVTVMTESNLEERMIKKGLRGLKMGKWIDRIQWVQRKRQMYLKKKPFDAVLLSPKASKIGIRPRISGYLKEEDILRLSRESRKLVEGLLPSVIEGGRLLFLLPSLDPAEGEENIEYFIQELGLQAFARKREVGHKGAAGYSCKERVLRSYPDIDDDEGWFASLLFK